MKLPIQGNSHETLSNWLLRSTSRAKFFIFLQTNHVDETMNYRKHVFFLQNATTQPFAIGQRQKTFRVKLSVWQLNIRVNNVP